MSASQVPGGESQITSAIHLEFIRSVTEGDDKSGLQAVEEFHRALFLNQHGRDLERHQQERIDREQRLDRLESQLRLAQDRLESEVRYVSFVEDGVTDDKPSAPWTAWDRAMFVVATLAIACLLAFGVLNVSFNLLDSGIVTFAEHPYRAYFWAALLPVGALAVKVGWDFLSNRRRRAAYLWTCLFLGIVGVLVWVAAYASIYPTLSRSAAEQLGALNVFDDPSPAPATGFLGRMTPGGVKWVDMVLVAAQAVAEIFLSAVLGMYLTQLYARHRPVRLAPNPVFVQFDAERRRLEGEVTAERLALAEARGNQARLEHQLAVFVSYARTLFHREAAARRDRSHRKHLLIQDMAEKLRRRLDALDHDPDGVSRDDHDHGNGSGDSPVLPASLAR